MRKIKALFFAANPAFTTPLKLDEEIRAVTEKIRAAKYRDSIDLESAWAVRPDDLIQKLNEHKPQIVHFSAHGDPSGEILFLDRGGNPKPVGAGAMQALLRTMKDNIRLVLLNACYSQSQARVLTQEIDCAIGMPTAVSDEAAIIFAASFYRAIGFGRSVTEAFEQGRTALLLEGLPEENNPELLVKDGVEPSRIVLLDTGRYEPTGAAHPMVDSQIDENDMGSPRGLKPLSVAVLFFLIIFLYILINDNLQYFGWVAPHLVPGPGEGKPGGEVTPPVKSPPALPGGKNPSGTKNGPTTEKPEESGEGNTGDSGQPEEDESDGNPPNTEKYPIQVEMVGDSYIDACRKAKIEAFRRYYEKFKPNRELRKNEYEIRKCRPKKKFPNGQVLAQLTIVFYIKKEKK